MNPLPPMRRIFIFASRNSGWRPLRSLYSAPDALSAAQSSKALHKFVEVAAFDKADASNLDRLQSACAQALQKKFARQPRELRRFCNGQRQTVNNGNRFCYGSARRFCWRSWLHIDHRDHGANSRAATRSGHESHRSAGELLLTVAFKVTRRKPRFLAVLTVMIDNIQVTPAYSPLDAARGYSQ